MISLNISSILLSSAKLGSEALLETMKGARLLVLGCAAMTTTASGIDEEDMLRRSVKYEDCKSSVDM